MRLKGEAVRGVDRFRTEGSRQVEGGRAVDRHCALYIRVVGKLANHSRRVFLVDYEW